MILNFDKLESPFSSFHSSFAAGLEVALPIAFGTTEIRGVSEPAFFRQALSLIILSREKVNLILFYRRVLRFRLSLRVFFATSMIFVSFLFRLGGERREGGRPCLLRSFEAAGTWPPG